MSAALVLLLMLLRREDLSLRDGTLRPGLLAGALFAAEFAGGWLRGNVSAQMLGGDTLAVLAGAAWGVTTVVVRGSALSDAPPAKTLLYQLVVACVLLVGAAAASGQVAQVSLTPVAWASLLFQGVVVSFASYLAWFWLLRRYAASQVSVFSFLTPLFGVSFGVIVLGERVDLAFGIGAVLVLAGITVVSAPGSRRKAERLAPSAGACGETTGG
jgi:drug/metabolite transporter (DMT)-like permease